MADRAMFFAQRMSVLLSWQMEYTTAEILSSPYLRAPLDDMTTLVETVSRLVDIADRLPEDIDAATESTFERAAELLVDQRQQIIELLESEDPRFRSALADVNTTLDSANGLTVEVGGLIDAIDDLTTSLDVDRWIGKLFRNTVILIVLFFACALGTGLAYRRLSLRP